MDTESAFKILVLITFLVSLLSILMYSTSKVVRNDLERLRRTKLGIDDDSYRYLLLNAPRPLEIEVWSFGLLLVGLGFLSSIALVEAQGIKNSIVGILFLVNTLTITFSVKAVVNTNTEISLFLINACMNNTSES